MSLKVLDYAGKTVATLEGGRPSPVCTGWAGTWRGPARSAAAAAPAGTYRVVLSVDGEEQSQPLQVEDDPNVPRVLLSAEEKAERAEEQERYKEEMEKEEHEEQEQGERPIRRIDY